MLIHHEGKSGKVSGAWEGSGDTLFHVTGQGPGRTRLYIQKARWASSYHHQKLDLVWTDGEGFAVEDKPEHTDDDLAAMIVAEVRKAQGTAWKAVERAIKGVGNDRLVEVRNRMLERRELVNVVEQDGVEVGIFECPKGRRASLHTADDPSIAHLAQEFGPVPGQSSPLGGGTGSGGTGPWPAALRATGQGPVPTPPSFEGMEPDEAER